MHRSFPRLMLVASATLATLAGNAGMAGAQSATLESIGCPQSAIQELQGGSAVRVTVGSTDAAGCDEQASSELAQCLAAGMAREDALARQEALEECLGSALPEDAERESAGSEIVAGAEADRGDGELSKPDAGDCGAGYSNPVASGPAVVEEVVRAGVTTGPYVMAFDKYMPARSDYIDSVATSDTQPEQSERLKQAQAALELAAAAAQAGQEVPKASDGPIDRLVAWVVELFTSKSEPKKEAQQPPAGSDEAGRPAPGGEELCAGSMQNDCELAGSQLGEGSSPTELCRLLGQKAKNPDCDPELVNPGPDGGEPCEGEAEVDAEVAIGIATLKCLSIVQTGPDGTSPCEPTSMDGRATPIEPGQVCGDPQALTNDDQCYGEREPNVVDELVDGHFGGGPKGPDGGPPPSPPTDGP